MRNSRGFTLIETLVATAILVSGLVAVAYMFSYSARTNITTQQITSGTLLLYNKMEELKASGMANLTVGGGLSGAAPTPNYFDYVSIGTNGAIVSDTVTASAPYVRVWQITGANPRTVTIVVFAQRAGIGGQRMELIRATTSVTSTF